MELRLITECYNYRLGGLSRYEKTLIHNMQDNFMFTFTHISDIKKASKIKQFSFLLSDKLYKKKLKETNVVTHLLNQQLALSLNFVPINNVVVTVHDLAFIVPKYFNKYSILDKLRYKLVMRGLKRANWIITNANFTKQEIIKYLGFSSERIFVVPLGVDHKVFNKKNLSCKDKKTYRRNHSGPVILYVGSEIPRMNLSVLIQAIALLRKDIQNVKLLKIGESKCKQERQKTLKLIKKLDLQEAVEFIEYVSEHDLVNYYNSADIFVYPIEYTGYGLPPLEAMACGCPVITTTTSTLPEVVGDAALLFDSDDPQQLREHMFKILKSNELQKDLQKKGFARARNLTWNKCAKNTIEVYKNIIINFRKIKKDNVRSI